MACYFYHVQTVGQSSGYREVRVRAGRTYGAGTILAEGTESGNMGDVLPQLLQQCCKDGSIDDRTIRYVGRDADIPPSIGDRLVPLDQ